MTENGQFPNGDDTQNDMKDDAGEFDAGALQKLRDAVGSLPRTVVPANDAWPSIRARIESTRVRPLNSAIGTFSKVHWTRSWPARSAIAATLLLAIGGYGTYRAFSKPSASSVVAPVQTIAATPPDTVKRDTTTSLPAAATTTHANARREMNAVFARYDVAASDLESDFKSKRDKIDPEAVAVLDSCIRTIDSAIAESRSALKATPDNATVAELLTATYQQKLDLLRRAADLPLRSF